MSLLEVFEVITFGVACIVWLLSAVGTLLLVVYVVTVDEDDGPWRFFGGLLGAAYLAGFLYWLVQYLDLWSQRVNSILGWG